MNNDMNFEFELKKRLSEEGAELPESLKKENVIKMLEKESVKTEEKKKVKLFPRVLATAAALAVTVAAVYFLPAFMPERGLVEVTTTTAVAEEQQETTENYKVIDNGSKATKLLQAESNEDIKKHFVKILRGNIIDDAIDSIGNAAEDALGIFDGTDGAAVENYADSNVKFEAPAETVATTAAAAVIETTAAPQMEYENDEESYIYAGLEDDAETEDSYGKTNTQVENVDEADIIKNDGKYLYILSGGVYKVDPRVTILDADTMEIVSRVEIEDEDYNYHIHDMYLNGDRLVLIAYEGEKYDDSDEAYYNWYYSKSEKIVSFVYDISDRENPSFIRKVSQDGYDYISSRMIDGVLYTVSSYWVSGDSEKKIEENAIPYVNGEEIACDCIYIYDYDSTSYVVVTAYDTKLDNGKVNSISILGSGTEVYCSQDALYVAGVNYDYNDIDNTDIYAFSIDGENISYKASGNIKGTFLNQFSFDEYEGNLRVATTYYSYKHDVDVSNVYVLDKSLQLIGALEDIAYDEQVKSVRFMGDTGYIVTFRNTDPLFTLDLSDPSAPKVVGEVKLPGFSSYLHPVGEGLVVGIGYDGDEENADFSSLKVSLFDVSDLKNPKEVDTFVLKNASSDVLYNPKAFISYPEENLIGFPVMHYDSNEVLSYKLLKIENGEISSHLGYVHKTERPGADIFRGTYIGKKLYTIDNYNVCEFDIDTAELLRSCEILNVDDDKSDYYIIDDIELIEGEEITLAMLPDTEEEETVTYGQPPADDSVIYHPVGEETTTVAVIEATTQPPSYYIFTAKVIEIYDNGGLLVEVEDAGSTTITVGSQVSVPSKLSEDADFTEVKLGESVRVTFDGVIQELYPLQLPNVLSVEPV